MDTIPGFYVIINIVKRVQKQRKEASMNIELTKIEAIAIKVTLKNEIVQTASFLKRFKKDNNKIYYKNSLYLMKQKTSVLRKLKKELNK